MTMMSYGQNQEDVRLARAFAGKTSGFYVDVGAHDPVYFSLTKHFYDLGWHGVNIDAAKDLAANIKAARPRDVTLNVGVSNRKGELTFYRARGDAAGLSTFSREEVERHKRAGYLFDEHSVPVQTLATITAEYATEPIDFMSVDVEGLEREVLEGADLESNRPKIIVVEATRPLLTEQSHGQWEGVLLEARYKFVVFDGLNRYYVAEEHTELAEPLAIPPNPHDDYRQWTHQLEIDALKRELGAHRLPIRIARRVVSATDTVSRLLSRRDR